MVKNLVVEYEEGGHGCNGSHNVYADTHLGRFEYERELPMDLQMDDGLDFNVTLAYKDLTELEECPYFDEGASDEEIAAALEAFLKEHEGLSHEI